jgi:hypothetical protein
MQIVFEPHCNEKSSHDNQIGLRASWAAELSGLDEFTRQGILARRRCHPLLPAGMSNGCGPPNLTLGTLGTVGTLGGSTFASLE